MVMDNLQFYLLKSLKQKQTYNFCYKIFIYFIVCLWKTLYLYQIFKLLIRAHIETLPWAPFCIDTPQAESSLKL